MDRRAFKNFITKRSSIWTLSLCMTGIIVLGGLAAVDSARRPEETQTEKELDPSASLEAEVRDRAEDVNDTLLNSLDGEDGENFVEDSQMAAGDTVLPSDGSGDPILSEDGSIAADSSDTAVSAGVDGESAVAADSAAADSTAADAYGTVSDGLTASRASEGIGAAADVTDGSDTAGTAEASSANVISEQVLLQEGIQFSDEESLLWPSAGTILIDYSMDGSVYFPTLNQYKYNPALIIGSAAGNQVLASARGMVESITVDEVTGTTLVLNIGNGYRLTYGQLKELAVAEGDVVEEGALLGYVSEPTKYFSEEGSNLYFEMTQDGQAVDPVLYLE